MIETYFEQVEGILRKFANSHRRLRCKSDGLPARRDDRNGARPLIQFME